MVTKPQVLIITAIILITAIIIATVTTAFLPVIITTINHRQRHRHPEHPPLPSPYDDVSQFLRSNGFNFTANIIYHSPDLFISSPETTIFAIPDVIISNITIDLLSYHISPNKYTFQDLFHKPINTCLCTLFQPKKISITKKDGKNHLLEINNVLITNPDMFIHHSVVIHAVNGPFSSFNELPICNVTQNQVTNNTIGVNFDVVKIKAEWKMVVKFLTSSGFTPFAFWLYNVFDGIVKDHPHVHSMTIFAPPVIEILEMPANMVSKFMRYHIVPKKYSFKHLVSMSKGASIMTLCPGKEIEITGTVGNVSDDQLLLINRVEITSPDLLSSRSFVVHGIARAFDMNGDARVFM